MINFIKFLRLNFLTFPSILSWDLVKMEFILTRIKSLVKNQFQKISITFHDVFRIILKKEKF